MTDPIREPIFTTPLVTLMIANGALRLATAMTITLVPLYLLDRGESATVAGLTTTIYMLAAVVTRPVAGRLVDSRGRYVVLVAGGVLCVIGAGLYLLAMPLVLFLAVRAVQGVGFSLNGTAVMTVATDLIPERRMAEGIGYLGLEATLAQIGGPPLAIAVLQIAGYPIAFAAVFLFTLLTVLLRIPLRPRLRRLDGERLQRRRASSRQSDEAADSEGERAAAGPLWTRIVDRDASRPALVLLFVMVGAASVNTFFAAYALHRGIAGVSLFFIASGTAVALSRLFVGRVESAIGPAGALIGGIAAITVSLAGMAWVPNLGAVIAAGLLFGGGMGIVQPTVAALAVMSSSRAKRGMANSTVFLAMDLSQAVSALGLGVVATAFGGVAGGGSVFLVSAAITTATLLLLVMRRRTFGVP